MEEGGVRRVNMKDRKNVAVHYNFPFLLKHSRRAKPQASLLLLHARRDYANTATTQILFKL